MERRDLLRWLASSGALAAFGRLGPDDLAAFGERIHATLSEQPSLRSLTAEQAAIVTAAAERIIPRTDTPGATDANVTAFIDVMLTDWYPPVETSRFLQGIAELDTRAIERHQRRFVACTADRQEALLTESEDTVVALRRTNAGAANAHWFALLKYLTVYGYCTSEPGMRQFLGSWPPPMRYDGAAPLR